MDDPNPPDSLLNIYEMVNEVGGEHRHYLCFLDPDRARSHGIDPRSVVGEFTPGPGKEFDPETLALNGAFVDAFTGYMNLQAVLSPEMQQEATRNAGGFLYVLDPRFQNAEGKPPEAADLLGRFSVDDSGAIVPDSFTYNEQHAWFDPTTGVSGVLSDRQFYDWLHSGTGPAQ